MKWKCTQYWTHDEIYLYSVTLFLQRISEGNSIASANSQSTENMTLEIANKVFSQSKTKILPEYKAVAEKSFLSGAQELDFADSEGSRNVINSWVEEKTRNKIKDLIPSSKYVLFIV